MLDRTQLRNIDWSLILLLVLNSLVGVAFIYSSSHYLPGNYYLKQIIWIVISLTALFLFLSVDYNLLVTYSPYFYFFLLLLLTAILFFGIIIAGAKSWIKLPFFQIQPSEVMKIALILILAHLFAEFRSGRVTWDKSLLTGLLTFFPILLVSLQPDLGTAFSYIPILLAVLLLAGLKKKVLALFLILSLLLGIAGWSFFLKDYQKSRLTTILFPSQDPLRTGYHSLQSKIAVGSGGFFGKGFTKGTQSQLRFLPARHTDFIFSVIGEEFGFIGIVSALLLYFLFLSRLFNSVWKSKDRAGVYVVFMVSVMIASQFFINVLMTIGLFPITGIPLPLLSYGGSSLFTNYLAVSLVLNVKMRRFVFL